MARRAMLLGLNQVIMMAFAIVVLAVAARRRRARRRGQQRPAEGERRPGVRARTRHRVRRRSPSTGSPPANERGAPARSAASACRPSSASTRSARRCVGGGVRGRSSPLIAKLAGADDFPAALTIDVTEPINDAVGWVNDNFRTGVPVVGGTGSFSDFLVIHVLDPVRDVLLDAPWWAVVAAAVAIGWASGGLAARARVRRLLRRHRRAARPGTWRWTR